MDKKNSFYNQAIVNGGRDYWQKKGGGYTTKPTEGANVANRWSKERLGKKQVVKKEWTKAHQTFNLDDKVFNLSFYVKGGGKNTDLSPPRAFGRGEAAARTRACVGNAGARR